MGCFKECSEYNKKTTSAICLQCIIDGETEFLEER